MHTNLHMHSAHTCIQTYICTAHTHAYKPTYAQRTHIHTNLHMHSAHACINTYICAANIHAYKPTYAQPTHIHTNLHMNSAHTCLQTYICTAHTHAYKPTYAQRTHMHWYAVQWMNVFYWLNYRVLRSLAVAEDELLYRVTRIVWCISLSLSLT